MIDPETTMARLLEMRRQIRSLSPVDSAEATASTEASRDALLTSVLAAAEEVMLTPMTTLPGLACKAAYLEELVEEGDGDLAVALARSLANDVLAMAWQAGDRQP